ncbi:hypothetical protein MHYP_G00180890 [Metynnis hypsauchen]
MSEIFCDVEKIQQRRGVESDCSHKAGRESGEEQEPARSPLRHHFQKEKSKTSRRKSVRVIQSSSLRPGERLSQRNVGSGTNPERCEAPPGDTLSSPACGDAEQEEGSSCFLQLGWRRRRRRHEVNPSALENRTRAGTTQSSTAAVRAPLTASAGGAGWRALSLTQPLKSTERPGVCLRVCAGRRRAVL